MTSQVKENGGWPGPVQLTHPVMAYQAIVLFMAACFADSHLTSSETKPIARLVLSPERVTTHPDRPVEFTVVGLSTGGDTVPISVSWKAGHGTVRETPDVPDQGVGRKVGDYQNSAVGIDTVVVADTSGLTDTSEVDITSDVSTVEVLPAVVALRPGGTRQLAATLRDSAGRPGRQVGGRRTSERRWRGR